MTCMYMAVLWVAFERGVMNGKPVLFSEHNHNNF
jgi:hypothetical protein